MRFDGKIRYDEEGRPIPTAEQLGVDQDEMFTWSIAKTQRAYDIWNAERLRIESGKGKIKAEREHLKSASHWYNTVSKTVIREALIKAIPHYPKVMAGVVKPSTPKNLMDYYTSGYHRVVEHNISLHPIPFSKLKRFPLFDEKTNTIVGSYRQVMTMYMELFPPLLRTKSKVELS